MLQLFETHWKDLWGTEVATNGVGSIFTRPDIVDLILDLAGYSVGGERLALRRVLEPGCGDGAFLSAVMDRLISSEKAFGCCWDDPMLDHALRAVDIDKASLTSARETIVQRLVHHGCPGRRAGRLADLWIVHADFLLSDWPYRFDLVVGNPPYVRIEEIPRQVLDVYRQMFSTATDRADLYVAFIEKGLSLLSENGVLAYICSNRFAKNKYGLRLRELIARSYHVRNFINLEHTQPFQQDVSAYPSIIVIDRKIGTPTYAATLTNLDSETLDLVRKDITGNVKNPTVGSRFPQWYPTGEPWASTSSGSQSMLNKLQSRYPLLEDSAPETRVGIGVATGADRVFVLPQADVGIESSRQLPLLLASQINPQGIAWTGTYVVNPFDDDGGLVPLDRFPGLREYFERHRIQLSGRYIAKGRPHAWYRTIDRIWTQLRSKPKLLLPDIQSGGVVGSDPGMYYPHHNLYWITSGAWNLDALKTILRSTLVRTQVEAYSVQMRGGSLRYQAQTLRRVRVPMFERLTPSIIDDLVRTSTSLDQVEIDGVTAEAYAL